MAEVTTEDVLDKISQKSQKSRIVCEVCEDDEAISRCTDCKEYLCWECQRAHQRAVKMKKHEIATLEDLRSGKATFKSKMRDEVPKCKKHTNQEVCVFCKTCKVLICPVCTPTQHVTTNITAQNPAVMHIDSNMPVPAGVQQRAMKYVPAAAGARNPQLVQAMPKVAQQAVPQQAIKVVGQEPLTPSMLAAATPQQQKQMLGERLLPLIQRSHGELAGKITGMMLEIDNSELLHMLESYDLLKATVDKVVNARMAHKAKERPAKQIIAQQAMPQQALPQQAIKVFGQEPLTPRLWSSVVQPRTMKYVSAAAGAHNPQLVQAKPKAAQQAVPQYVTTISGQEPLTPSMLAAATPQQQKQMLEERLLPMIQRSHGELAGKITGMMLELDNSELLHMLESYDLLKATVDKVVNARMAHKAKERPTKQTITQQK